MLVLTRCVHVVAVLHDKHSARVARADGYGHHLDPVGFTRTINLRAVRNTERAAIRMRRRAIKNHIRPIALARSDEITGTRPGVRRYIDREALDILAPLFDEHNVDPERPILAAISRYDIHKNQATIIKAFQRLREERKFDKPPYLIFLGNTAPDDPEGGAMLESLRKEADNDPDVRFWVNVANNDQVVGALAQLARVFVHISTREGFGLVVSEALWQGTPVIGSTAGGIPKQVVNGVTGYLVEPKDVDAVARLMARFLDDPGEAAELGERGREHVRNNFLMPELVSRYLAILQHHAGLTDAPPHFQISSIGNGRPRSAGTITSNGAVRRVT